MNDRDLNRSDLAAYVAGRLGPAEASRLEAAMSTDEALATEAESLRGAAEFLSENLRGGPGRDFRLSSDRLATIRAAASGHIVRFPNSMRRKTARWRSVVVRRFAPAAAAAVAVIVSAVAGFNAGRAAPGASPTHWQVANQSPSEIATADNSYALGYGLDRGVHWPARQASLTALSTSEPPNFGLPGPAPSYLIRESYFLLQ